MCGALFMAIILGEKIESATAQSGTLHFFAKLYLA
jgi:hypothetical protein